MEMRHVISDLYENKSPYQCLKVAVFKSLQGHRCGNGRPTTVTVRAILFFFVIHRKYVADVICTANLHNVWRAIIAALAMF